MDVHGMLNEIRKATDMGIVGIEAVERKAKQETLRDVLWQQKQEYHEIYNQADGLLQAKGGSRQDLPQTILPVPRRGNTTLRIARLFPDCKTKLPR